MYKQPCTIFYYINILVIVQKFHEAAWRFLNIFWNFPKMTKITSNCWRLSIWRFFDHTPTSLRVNHDFSEIINIMRIWKICHRVPDPVSYEFYEWCIFYLNTCVHITSFRVSSSIYAGMCSWCISLYWDVLYRRYSSSFICVSAHKESNQRVSQKIYFLAQTN